VLKLAVAIVLAGAAIALFDLVAYFAVPADYTRFAVSYRQTQLLSGATGHPAMSRGYPRHYFHADDAMGFDIAPNVKKTPFVFNPVPHEVFSNGLGCFDRNEAPVFRGAKEYHYFAGDSFTWGYADYESKFATVWERATGKIAAKCGVSHTGQAAQFEKFKRVTAAIGKLPVAVYVGFYVNDPANDAAYPHTTVIEGYMVDTVWVREGALVRPDVNEIRGVVESSLRELDKPRTAVEELKARVWIHSLSANIVNEGGRALARSAARAAASHSAQGAAAAGPASCPSSKFGDNLYCWYNIADMKTSYATDAKAAANREAILRWARHARENSYRLVLLLFPPKTAFDDAQFFDPVKQFLQANGIEHLDLAPLFKAEGFREEDLYWADNGHWHGAGNRAVGRLLAQRY
jgi:hypothetical protein